MNNDLNVGKKEQGKRLKYRYTVKRVIFDTDEGLFSINDTETQNKSIS